MPKLKPVQPQTPRPPHDPALARKAVSVAEASLIMGVGQTNLRVLIASGKLRVIRIGQAGRGIIIPLAAIDEFLTKVVN